MSYTIIIRYGLVRDGLVPYQRPGTKQCVLNLIHTQPFEAPREAQKFV